MNSAGPIGGARGWGGGGWRVLSLGAVAVGLLLASLSASAATTETFESERYGYSITRDEAVWGSRVSSTSDEYKRVEIPSGASLFSLEAFPSDGNDAGDCLDAVTRRLEQADGVDNVTEDEDLSLPTGSERMESRPWRYPRTRSAFPHRPSMRRRVRREGASGRAA